uniref:Secreted protein n=1 Tax=Picea glauca TaxID=3330 RepID=A0A101M2J5_PICGL|nr:hypothetical protein ABT39_MTgene2980 [Picea glauca]
MQLCQFTLCIFLCSRVCPVIRPLPLPRLYRFLLLPTPFPSLISNCNYNSPTPLLPTPITINIELNMHRGILILSPHSGPLLLIV